MTAYRGTIERRLLSKLPCAFALGLAALLAAPGAALANPQGGSIAGGQATIAHTGPVTTIDQKSQKAIINWESFSIGAGETTRFNQSAGTRAIALNRVTGGSASEIRGALQANGGVWLVNPRGVLFGPTAQVDVHSLVATTANILDADFLAGKYDFRSASPDPDAGIRNEGNLSVGEAGLAALVAPSVRNDGFINGRLGTVILAGVPTFTIDFQGDGLVQFAGTSSVSTAPDGAAALAHNTGTIRAEGGSILLTAAAAAGVVADAINTSGLIEARDVSLDGGRIVLAGGPSGRVVVDGTLDAGAAAGAAAGSIEVTGANVVLTDHARLDVSGGGGGGTVAVGGRLDGSGTASEQLIVAPGAQVVADASVAGDGGTIAMRAEDEFVFAGSASARGGPLGGNGGTVDTTAGDGRLLVVGHVDTTAPAGLAGEWRVAHAREAKVKPGVVYDPAKGGASKYSDGEATISADAINGAAGRIAIRADDLVLIDAAISSADDIVLQGRDVTLRDPLTTTGTVRIIGKYVRSRGDGIIAASRLDLGSEDHAHGGGNIRLRTAVGELAIGPSESGTTRYDQVFIHNHGDLAIGEIDSSGIDVGSLFLEVDGVLSVLRPIKASSAGDALVIVTDRFVNGAGPAALQAPQGRWIVYSVDPVLDARGSVDGSFLFDRNFASTPPDQLGVSGNVFVYQLSPVLPPVLPPAPSALPVAGMPTIQTPAPLGPSPSLAPAQRRLTDEQIAEVTRATTIPYDDIGAVAEADIGAARLVTVAPPAESAEDEDLLFASDGNQELWGLSGGR
jgi:filamentous hemagglutinin family protein